jgi:hypothetical protein
MTRYRLIPKREDPICALCGKPIRFKDRYRFSMWMDYRNKYSPEYRAIEDMTLKFHVKCVRKINVRVESLYELLILMNKVSKRV